MINKNITRKDIINALMWIDKHGIPKNRNSRKYYLEYQNIYYPPKYVISIATKFAAGQELDANEFSGGDETNKVLVKRGFQIVTHKK